MANNNNEDNIQNKRDYAAKMQEQETETVEPVSFNYQDAESSDKAVSQKVSVNHDIDTVKDNTLEGAEQQEELAKQDRDNMSTTSGSADTSPVDTNPQIDIKSSDESTAEKNSTESSAEKNSTEASNEKSSTESSVEKNSTETTIEEPKVDENTTAKTDDNEPKTAEDKAEAMLKSLKKDEGDTSIEDREKKKKAEEAAKQGVEKKGEDAAKPTVDPKTIENQSTEANKQNDVVINNNKIEEKEANNADNDVQQDNDNRVDDENSTKKQEPAQTDAELEEAMNAKMAQQNKIKSEATEIGLAIGRSIGYGMKLEKKGGADDTEEAAADGQNKSDTAAADDIAGEAAADGGTSKKSAKKPYFEKTPFFTDEEFEKGRQKEEKDKNKSIQPDTREYFNFKKKFLKQKSDEYSVQKLKEAEQQDAQKPKYSVFYVQGFTAGYAQGQQFRRTEEAQKRAAAEKEKEKDPNYKLGKLIGSQAGTKSVMGETEFDLTVGDVVYKCELSTVKTNALSGLDPNGKAMSEMFTEAYIKFFSANYIKAQQLKKKGSSLEERLKEPFFKKGYEGGNRLQRAKDLTPEDKASLEKSKLEYVEKGADAKAKQNPDFGKERAGFLLGYSAGHYQKKAEATAAAKAQQESKIKDPVFLLGQTAGKIHGMIAAVFGRAQVASMVSNTTALKQAGLLMQVPPHIQLLLQNGGEGAGPELFVNSSGASLLANSADENDPKKKADLQKRYTEQLGFYAQAFRFHSNNAYKETANNKGQLEQNKKMNKPGYAKAMQVVFQHEEKVDENDKKPISLKLNVGGMVAYAEFKCQFLPDGDAHKAALQDQIDKAYALLETEDADYKQGFNDARNFYQGVVKNPKNPVGQKIRVRAHQQNMSGKDDNTKLCYSYGKAFANYKKGKQDRLAKAKSLGIDTSAVEEKDIKFIQKIKLDFKLEIVKLYYPQGIVVNKEDTYDSLGSIISYSQKFEEALDAALPRGVAENDQVRAQINEGLRFFDNGYNAGVEASKPKVIKKGNDEDKLGESMKERVDKIKFSGEDKTEAESLFKKGAGEGYVTAYNYIKKYVSEQLSFNIDSIRNGIATELKKKKEQVDKSLSKKDNGIAKNLRLIYDEGLNDIIQSENDFGVCKGIKDGHFFAAGFFEAKPTEDNSASELGDYKNPMHQAYAEGKQLAESSAGFDEFAQMMGSDATKTSDITDPDEKAAYEKGLGQCAAAWEGYFALLYGLPATSDGPLQFAAATTLQVNAKLVKSYQNNPEAIVDAVAQQYEAIQIKAYNSSKGTAEDNNAEKSARTALAGQFKQYRKGLAVSMKDAESKVVELVHSDMSEAEKAAYDSGLKKDDKGLTAFYVLKHGFPLLNDLQDAGLTIGSKNKIINPAFVQKYGGQLDAIQKEAVDNFYEQQLIKIELAIADEAKKNEQEIADATIKEKASEQANTLKLAFEKGYIICRQGAERKVLQKGSSDAQHSLGYVAAFVEIGATLPGQIADMQQQLQQLSIEADPAHGEYIKGYNQGLELAQMYAAGLVNDTDLDKQINESNKQQGQGDFSKGTQAAIKDATLHAKDKRFLEAIPDPKAAFQDVLATQNNNSLGEDDPEDSAEKDSMPDAYRDGYLKQYWNTKDPLSGEVEGARSVVEGGSDNPKDLYTAVKRDDEYPVMNTRAVKDVQAFELRFKTTRDRYKQDPNAAKSLKDLESVAVDPAKLTQQQQVDDFVSTTKKSIETEQIENTSKNFAAYTAVRDLGMQQQVQADALQQHSNSMQELKVLKQGIEGLGKQLAVEGLSDHKKLKLQHALEDLQNKKASLEKEQKAVGEAVKKNKVQAALNIDYDKLGFQNIESGLSFLNNLLSSESTIDEYLELELTEKEKNDLKTDAEASKDKKPSKTLSTVEKKERLTEAQKESIRAAFVQGVNREKEVYYAEYVEQLQKDFAVGNQQNYENVDLVLTDMEMPLEGSEDNVAIDIGKKIDAIETGRQDTGQVLLDELPLISLVEEQEGILYGMASDINEARQDIIKYKTEISRNQKELEAREVANNEEALREELIELYDFDKHGVLLEEEEDRIYEINRMLKVSDDQIKKIENLKMNEKAADNSIQVSLEQFTFFLNSHVKVGVGNQYNDEILDYADKFDNSLEMNAAQSYSGKNIRFNGSGDYIIMPNAEDITSEAQIEIFKEGFQLKGTGFEFKQQDSHITILSGTAVIPTLQAGNSAPTDKQYTFNRLALSLQSDLKSQIQEKSGDMIIGISELKSTGDRSYPVDQSNLDKDSDNNVNSDSLNV